MPKRLLLIGGNFAPELTGIGKYNGEMIAWLANYGYECTVITSFPHYPQWRVQPPYTRSRYWYKKEKSNNITVYRCPQYIPAQPSGKKRVLMDITFAISAAVIFLRLLFMKKSDAVMVVAPPFHLGLLGVLYKKIKGARFIYHIQDLQIEAARDLGMISSPSMIRILFNIERYILGKADVVSSISEGMIKKIREKSGREVSFLPNWVDVQLFHPVGDKGDVKKDFGLSTEDKVILYSGAIGEKQGLEAILHAARTMRKERQIKFLICGAGPYREQLRQQAINLQLDNVYFRDPEPFNRFNRFLNMADLHLVIQKSSAGDLVMPSKLTTILAVGGLALVTAAENTTLYELVKAHDMGIVVTPEDSDALIQGIFLAISKKQEHIAGNARQYALNYLSIDKILSELDLVIRAST